MGPLLIILLGAIATFWWLGLLTPARMRAIGGIGGILIGLYLTARGQPLIGLPIAAASGYLGWTGLKAKTPLLQMNRREAAKILGVPEDASEAQVREAYRLAAAAAHPDRGGSSEKMQRLNAARDTLTRARPTPTE